MKEKYQLASKIVGLVIISGSVISLMSFLVLLFFQPDYTELWQSYSRGMQNELTRAWSGYMAFERKLFIQFAIFTVFPIFFGVYLMTPENIFIRIAFPNPKENKSYNQFGNMSNRTKDHASEATKETFAKWIFPDPKKIDSMTETEKTPNKIRKTMLKEDFEREIRLKWAPPSLRDKK